MVFCSNTFSPFIPVFRSSLPAFRSFRCPRKSNSFFSLYHPKRIDPLIQSLHLLLPVPSRFSNKVPVLPVTSFYTFLRTRSEHFFHSVTFSTAHKSICFISLRSPCLRTDLATFHSASTLVFAIAQDFVERLMASREKALLISQITYIKSFFIHCNI